MEGDFRPEFHVAQKSRRDKLRIQQDSNTPDNLGQIPAHHHDSLPYNYSPQMPLSLHNESDDKRANCDAATASFGNSYRPISDPHCFNSWKSIGLNTDWDLSGSQFRPPYLDSSSDVVSMPTAASSVYQNTLPELLVTSADIPELGHRNCHESDDRLHWISRAPELLASGELNYSNTQAHSLSLSSVPWPKVQKISDTKNVHGSRNWKSEHQLSGNSRPDLGTLAMARRNPGPLGPFTGYATILRSSKFLRPAQLLLDDLCCLARPTDNDETCDVQDKILDQVRVSDEAVSNDESTIRAIGHSGGGLLLAFDDSCDKNPAPARVNCLTDSFRPDHLQKKAMLLYMQDEVCKWYKQYHQQMQMVFSSFESVAGLSAATPNVSSAVKMVSKHFRCLKNAITDQLKSIRNALGEDLSSSAGGTSSANGGTSVSVLKFFDQSLQKKKRAGGLGSILEGHHVWRPQRGLPEGAVSILRAWLFDHFLHPYPTDTDKHMLASQTGLTRNQVSNWFINARVRLWKPMVEEIHMLEIKAGMSENGLETGKATNEASNQATNAVAQSSNMLLASALPEKQLEYLNNNPSESEASICMSTASVWNQDKRSRFEYLVPSSMCGPLMEMVPRIDMAPSLSAVSLTLGLRQSAQNAQRPPLPMLQRENHPHHHMRMHYGGHIIRDFVG